MRRLIGFLVIIGVVGIAVKSSGAFRTNSIRQQRVTSTAGPVHVAQHDGHTPSANAATLGVTVDGELTPSAIPDDRAHAHFLSAIARLSDNSRARDAALKELALSMNDRAALVTAATDLHAELKQLERDSKSGLSFRTAQQRQKTALEGTRRRVQATLSDEGSARLNNYIETRVKLRIKMYRGPMLSTTVELQK